MFLGFAPLALCSFAFSTSCFQLPMGMWAQQNSRAVPGCCYSKTYWEFILCGETLTGTYLTCATSISFPPEVFLPLETKSWMRSPKRQAKKQSCTTEGLSNPCHTGMVTGNQVSAHTFMVVNTTDMRGRQSVLYHKHGDSAAANRAKTDLEAMN